MRLTTDEEFSKMEKKDLIKILKNIGEFDAKENEKSFEDLLAKVKKFERTRYLACWHDGSSVGNHSHLLVTVNVLNDTASFLSDNEYYLKHKKKINVQASAEEPNMYILARCPSADQQLLYTDQRIGDIMNLKYPTKSSNNVEVNDVLRFFKGDSPARQFDGGHQKGGNFFYVVCPVHANHVKNVAGSNIKKVMSIKERIEKVKITTTSVLRLEKNTIKLHENMKKIEIIDELHQRSVKFSSSLPQKDLMSLLQYEMHGIQRLPALLYGYPKQSLGDLNLEQYEILPNEPLHDISNYIKNIYQEIPAHVS